MKYVVGNYALSRFGSRNGMFTPCQCIAVSCNLDTSGDPQYGLFVFPNKDGGETKRTGPLAKNLCSDLSSIRERCKAHGIQASDVYINHVLFIHTEDFEYGDVVWCHDKSLIVRLFIQNRVDAARIKTAIALGKQNVNSD